MKHLSILAALLLATAPGPAIAGAGSFTLVNSSGQAMSGVAIRRFGNGTWQPLSVAPAAGARAAVQFNDPDCAFDIRASLTGGKVAVWPGVNLCEASVVTLNRDESGAVWVDYD